MSRKFCGGGREGRTGPPFIEGHSRYMCTLLLSNPFVYSSNTPPGYHASMSAFLAPCWRVHLRSCPSPSPRPYKLYEILYASENLCFSKLLCGSSWFYPTFQGVPKRFGDDGGLQHHWKERGTYAARNDEVAQVCIKGRSQVTEENARQQRERAEGIPNAAAWMLSKFPITIGLAGCPQDFFECHRRGGQLSVVVFRSTF